jgi:3-methyladenine DNA glycosylase AlkD
MPQNRSITTIDAARRELHRLAEPERIPQLLRYFRCEPGGYGEGDSFRGVRVPNVRRVARQSRNLSMDAIVELLESVYHEDRLLAVILLVHRYDCCSGDSDRFVVRSVYLHHRAGINNWDLVDVSAPGVIGRWTCENGIELLRSLAGSENLWDRRIAMIATLSHTRRADIGPTLELADALLEDRHDLIHKASGWMLREAWKRDTEGVEDFLRMRRGAIPSVMFRYATELMDAEARAALKRA